MAATAADVLVERLIWREKLRSRAALEDAPMKPQAVADAPNDLLAHVSDLSS